LQIKELKMAQYSARLMPGLFMLASQTCFNFISWKWFDKTKIKIYIVLRFALRGHDNSSSGGKYRALQVEK